MKQKLQESLIAKIKNSQKDSILYKAIKTCCMAYLPEMRHIKICPEVILIEVLRVLDDIKEDPEQADEICKQRWFDLQLEYQEPNSNKETDIEIANLIGLILYMSALLLRWYDGEYAMFYHSRAETLCNEVATRIPDFDDYLQPFREKVLNYAESLTEWMNEYMLSECFLSDIILKVRATDDYRNEEKNKRIYYTLIYTYQGTDRQARIGYVKQKLEEWEWIDKISSENFTAFFCGGETNCHIVWKKTPAILYNLISSLIEQKAYINKMKKGSAKAIVANQFGIGIDQHKNRIEDKDNLRILIILFLLKPGTDIPMVKHYDKPVPHLTDKALIEALQKSQQDC